MGTVFKTESQVLGVKLKCVNVVKSFQPSEELIIENKLGTVTYNARFHFTPQTSKTCVQLNITLSTDSKAFVFTKPVLRQLALRELRTDLQALKIAVENKLK